MTKDQVMEVVDVFATDDGWEASVVENVSENPGGLKAGLLIAGVVLASGAAAYLGYKGVIYLKGKLDDRKHRKALENPKFEEVVDEGTGV